MDIGGWLRSLFLERYEAAFRENAIDADVLRDLTDHDLEKLGVLLGDRRKLLRAIAALDGASAAASSPVPVPSALISAAAASPTSSTVEVSGERRHVTAMFCDLVDLTGIAAKLDPDEWRGLVGAYLDAASITVTEWGGKVANKLGDGLIALFGYPVAHESGLQRAAHAAFVIQRSLAELNRKNDRNGKPTLAARIAIELRSHGDRCRWRNFWRAAQSCRASTGGIGAQYGDDCDPAAPDPRSTCHRRAR